MVAADAAIACEFSPIFLSARQDTSNIFDADITQRFEIFSIILQIILVELYAQARSRANGIIKPHWPS
jgi:hypothetical protein